jgi:hypothetical protein
MPDVFNHLAAFNRIATALENLPEDDVSALVTALESIANKTIPVADLTGVVTAINNKTIPSTDLTSVVTAINNISLPSGGGSTGGSLDCNCLADVIKPLIDKIDELVCVNVAIANDQHHIKNVLTYIGLDGPQFGIDAPPGSFIFPVPGDTAPSLPYTPDTTTQIDPETGAWTTPPIVDGVAYTYPPGGMRGAEDAVAYNNYKCDMATYIFRYTRAWFESIAAVPMVAGTVDFIYGAIEALVIAINYVLSTPASPRLVYSAAAGGVRLVKAGATVATAGPLILSTPILILLALVLVSMGALMAIIHTLTQQYLAMYNSRKSALICALYKAKTVEEARQKFMAILGENPVQISFWYDQIASYVLSDTLLSHLFACHPDFDLSSFTGLGALEGGCVDCILCEDMDESITVNKKSVYGYPVEPPAIEIRTGLVPHPIVVDLGTIDTDGICVVGRTEWRNGNAGARISINNGAWQDIFWTAYTETNPGGFSPLETMPFKEHLLELPNDRVTGNVRIEFNNQGVTNSGEYEVQSVGWRLLE